MSYTLSWYCTESVPRFVLRPWWAVWRHDTLIFEDKTVRRVLSLPDAEGASVEAAFHARIALLKKLMGRDVDMVQLEFSPSATPYISTEYTSTGRTK